ncbi:bifunctional demethylmenaquinone methyltransferase/2-methoxy-6-polyprenyl-1,4-benzoquinol methylase UbiE [Flaviaesturariibacter flavus]|uniref:Demethylmenaquinone methyltransferase n=1 Tax=Flaviaesturariibacter flavus TaxID=2502780 RepID=A0A4R1B989_9BACT|nr:bifunctional demethylmenaquinone methyltransferase/2-methoxy-6-polyprenyl-1,4-benzoquinol methylase UbiE [Flaviaesturariibacter flavus]TCJ13363.1 bifunctional demethylmenaquinone methyltransferase/2-methoxy-6-polyprenyl-1,4-benzoquinol methylase UbiE [Flaviaesturariibacter flavus]
MARYAHDNIKPFAEEGNKKEQVAGMFDEIAGRYDFMNRVLSARIDVLWRKAAMRALAPYKPQLLLDVATGTGDMALMAARILRPARIVGIDISEGMLAVGREKVCKANVGTQIELVSGDSETINAADNSFDAGMVAFGVRNFEHLEKGLGEILRVLKPGAPLVILEFSRPRLPVIRQLYGWYMGWLAPQMAKWFNQNKKAYQYLNASANAFPDRQDFVAILKNVGYIDTSFKPLSLGICCLYAGRKRQP